MDKVRASNAAPAAARLPLGGAGRAYPPMWKADLELARREADAIIETIDFARQDIVINVPGTGGREIDPPKRRAFEVAWQGGDATLVHLTYETNSNFPNSMPQGVETLRLVLAGIAARGGSHRVFLFGESQGSMVIGEAMSEPAVRAMVTRATLWGHPWASRNHYHDSSDSQIWEHSNADDPVAAELKGGGRSALEGLGKVTRGDFIGALPHLLRALLDPLDALNAGLWVAHGNLFPADLYHNPHNYDHALDEGLGFLRNGRGGASDAVQGAVLISDEAYARMIEAARHEFPNTYTRD